MSILAAYQWALAVASRVPRRSRGASSGHEQSRFLVLVPAHNEEHGLPHTLRSLAELRYPEHKVRVVVVADRCEDGTASVAGEYGVLCLKRRSGPPGKGAAIAWAIDELRNDRTHFDALIIIDADTIVDPGLLEAFDKGITLGHQIQQAYNYISNPWETPFTCLIAVTSTLRNGFFYKGKSRLGLSGMLMGTGMCFGRQVVERHGWTALSVGEDWEFSVSLLMEGEKIHFNPMARVLASESRGFHQASTQRLRWASGRHAVAGKSVWGLFRAGLRRRHPYLLDAALTLVAPNYSTQATLAMFTLFGAWFLSGNPIWHSLLPWATLVIGSLAAYFLLGAAFTEAPMRTLKGIALIPVFLPWRMAIELLGLLGYGRKRWLSTARITTPRQETDS